MSASSPIHGAQLPSPKWWRPFRDVPLILLAVLSAAAAVVGWVAQARITAENERPASAVAVEGAVAPDVAAACRAPLPATAAEPWIDGDGSAEAVWAAHADALAEPVVRGREGWAFYNDQIEQNFSQAIGRRHLSAVEVEAWADYFTALDDGLRERGVELLIEVTPSATSVYPGQLPEWTDGIVGSTPLDQLLVAAPDLPIVDFRADLRDAADDDVYTPVNSHWTDWGGYVGWQTIADCHAALYPDAAPLTVPAATVQGTGVEYNEYAAFGVADAGVDWTSPRYAEEPASVEVTDAAGDTTTVPGATPLGLDLLPASTTTSEAASDRTALILRDSMGNALSPLWQQEYAQTRQVQHRYDDWSSPPDYRALVDEYEPDVVIVQLAERHLVNTPVASPGF